MTTRKRKRSSFDDELLGLGRMVRILEEFPDVNTRARMARYIFERYLANVTLDAPPNLERTPAEIARAILETPVEGPSDAARQFLYPPEDDPQESLGLGVPPWNGGKIAGLPPPEEIPRLSKCAHGIRHGEKCFGCEAERQVAKDRHSAPPAPIGGGIAE